jgi:predicted transcriptional regulator
MRLSLSPRIILGLRQEGYTCRAITSLWGVSPNTISKYAGGVRRSKKTSAQRQEEFENRISANSSG